MRVCRREVPKQQNPLPGTVVEVTRTYYGNCGITQEPYVRRKGDLLLVTQIPVRYRDHSNFATANLQTGQVFFRRKNRGPQPNIREVNGCFKVEEE